LRRSSATLCIHGRCSSPIDLARLFGGRDRDSIDPGEALMQSYVRFVWRVTESPTVFVIFVTRTEHTLNLQLAANVLHDGDIYELTIQPWEGGPPLARWRERATFASVQRRGEEAVGEAGRIPGSFAP
jgi:hypothetical protein